MTSGDLLRLLVLRILKFKYLIFAIALLSAASLYLVAKRTPPVYSARTTLFPLTNSNNNAASSGISELVGGGGGMKNLSEEANISLEEVGRSRKTRDAVSQTRIPAFGNKMVGELLITDYNNSLSFFSKKIPKPKTDSEIVNIGSAILSEIYTAKPTKTGLIEVTFSSRDRDLLKPVSYILIDKITMFYKELKIKKAKSDFDFTEYKIDSLDYVLNRYDRQQIQFDKITLFVPRERLQYNIPKQNLSNDKMRVLSQKANAAANREEALWRLQKVTPIIEVLDKPDPPYKEERPSAFIFAISGFVLGLLLATLIIVLPPSWRYLNLLIAKALQPSEPVINTTTTTA